MLKDQQKTVTVDTKSGFCFGVQHAIAKAEEILANHKELLCLGDLVHNNLEMDRLIDKGLKIITHEEFFKLHSKTVLLRAHGEPPEVYEYAQTNQITLIDATCPVVLKLQQKVKKAYLNEQIRNGQIVIYGKKDHAEVIGLNGQTNQKAIVIENDQDIDTIDFSKPLSLFSQTTKSLDHYQKIGSLISQRSKQEVDIFNTVCKQVDRRVPHLEEFAKDHDGIIFVGGEKSSNAKYLYSICKRVNPDSFLVSSIEKLPMEQLKNYHSIGICGATSTPQWLMEKVAEYLVKN